MDAMNNLTRIEKTFAKLKARGEKALVAFLTAGDPRIETTKEFILEFEKRGADIIELGIPFSDPMADGPTIQAASERALKERINLPMILRLVASVRKVSQIPIILFSYYNPIFNYGIERFARDIKRAGVDGVLVVDLPPEEAGAFKCCIDNAGLDMIFLLTPTSDDVRMRLIAGMASGFIYYVSVTGVTGTREKLAESIMDSVKRIRAFTNLPICVGFGISTPLQAEEVSKWADGVVVGSAIIKLIEKNMDSHRLIKRVGDFVSKLKQALK